MLSFLYGSIKFPIYPLEYELLIKLWFRSNSEKVLSIYPPPNDSFIDTKNLISDFLTGKIKFFIKFYY